MSRMRTNLSVLFCYIPKDFWGHSTLPLWSSLYERHGYVKVGDLPDFIADRHSELLLYKRLS